MRKEELKRLNVKDITHPDDIGNTENLIYRLSRGEIEDIKYEKRYRHKKGNYIWVIIAATMLYDGTGKPLHYVSQVEDITKRKEIESDLLLSEKKYRTIF
jgi:PAS domain S-box-containing protein